MNKDLIHIIYILIIFAGCFLMFQLTFTHSEDITNLTLASGLNSHVKSNNLNLPFPNSIMEFNTKESLNQTFNKNIYDFHETLKQNYIYTKDYDCKYWSFVWLSYWEHNRDEWDFKIIKTNNHIFVILYSDNKYCTADQNNLFCQTLIN